MNADKRRSKPRSYPHSSTFIRGPIAFLAVVSAFAQQPRRIYEINGPGNSSPLAGQAVSVTAVVTAVRSATTSGKGFYLESLPVDRDADPNTSEGLLVFIGSAALPACAVVGNLISIAGTVADFVPAGEPTGSTPLTELTGASNCTVVGTNMLGNLPPPVTIDADNPLIVGGSAWQARKWLGMRVNLPRATVVGPSIGALNEPIAQSVVTGEFYVSVPDVPRPQRGPGLLATRRPGDAAATIPVWNGSPESLRVNVTQLAPAGAPYEVAAGALVTGLSGVMEFHTGEGQYQLFTNAAGAGAPIPASPIQNAVPVPMPQRGDLTIGSFNMERFYNNRDEGNGAVLLTAAAYQGRLNKASLAIRNVMQMPDILALEEIEGKRNTAGAIDPRVIDDLAAKVNADAVTAGQGNPDYSWCSAPTNDLGAISLAVMYKSGKVQAPECSVYGGGTRYNEPDGGNNVLNDRPPLTIKAVVTAPGSDSGIPVRLVVNHLRSLGGVDTPGAGSGDQVRTKRNQQAIYLAKLITGNGEQSTNWNTSDNLVLVGDFNAHQVNDGYTDLMNCIAGQPPPANTQYFTPAQLAVDAPCTPLVNPPLHLLTLENPAGYYSYSFDGSTSTLDHVLVNDNLTPRFRQLFYARNNADFPDGPTYRNDFNRPERVSDHDMPVLYLKLPMEVTSRTRVNVSQPAFNRRPGRHTEYISVTNTGTTPLTGPVYVFFHDLSQGVATPDLPVANSVPYAQIDLAAPLAPGETSGKVAVRFTNSSNGRIGYTTRRFDGTY